MSDTAQTTAPAPLLTVPQAAATLGIGRRLLWSLTAGGQLACVRINRRVLYAPADLAEFIDRHRDKRAPAQARGGDR
jgi:predicted DNA-binding transcriptional regulator AlpA